MTQNLASKVSRPYRSYILAKKLAQKLQTSIISLKVTTPYPAVLAFRILKPSAITFRMGGVATYNLFGRQVGAHWVRMLMAVLRQELRTNKYTAVNCDSRHDSVDSLLHGRRKEGGKTDTPDQRFEQRRGKVHPVQERQILQEAAR
jgi:hypothetical protein